MVHVNAVVTPPAGFDNYRLPAPDADEVRRFLVATKSTVEAERLASLHPALVVEMFREEFNHWQLGQSVTKLVKETQLFGQAMGNVNLVIDEAWAVLTNGTPTVPHQQQGHTSQGATP